MKQLILLVVVSTFLGCHALPAEDTPQEAAYNAQIASATEIAKLVSILASLAALDESVNNAGLEDLDALYGVEVKDPTNAFFESAQAAIDAYKELHQKQAENTSLRGPELPPELVEALEQL